MKKNITTNKSQTLESILKEAWKHPLLTVEKEVELANRIKQGDEEARKELYNYNLRYVASVAKLYKDRGMTLEELIEAGNKGLELATRKFDPQRGFKFISYAVWFITANILAFLETSKNNMNPSNLTVKEKCELVSRMSNVREKNILTRWFGLVKPQEPIDDISQSMNLTIKE